MSYVNIILNGLSRFVTNLGTNGWMVVSAIVITVGFICMQGYGSRKHY